MTASSSTPPDPAHDRRDDLHTAPAQVRLVHVRLQFRGSRREFWVVALLRATIASVAFGTPDPPAGVARTRARGQSILEFALVFPILMVLLGGAVQYGVVFAAKNSLTQVARDTARWASTQTYPQCNFAGTETPPGTTPPLLYQADQIGQDSSLIGYTAGMWHIDPLSNFTMYPYNTPLPSGPPFGVLPATPPNSEGVEVVWSYDTGGVCPPTNNIVPAYVTVRITHSVPILLPGLQYLPGLGTCGPSGCFIRLWSTSEFRMEPPRQ